MGVFDLFKPKTKPAPQIKAVIGNRPECDINKTAVIAELFKASRDQRDVQWHNAFYQNVATASFASDKPQVLTGPDGFPYFILRTPENGRSFESFCIQNMKDDFLINRGWGVVFNPTENNTASWVFTHGDIVNLYLNNEFITPAEEYATDNIEFKKTVGVIKTEEQVMIAQPSESYLPAGTRHALKIFLQSKGIKRPLVMMLTSGSEGKVTRKLAFNIPPENYPVTEQLDHLMQEVGWFLPRQYLLIPLSRKSPLAKGFNDL